MANLRRRFAFLLRDPAVVEHPVERGVKRDSEDQLFHELNVNLEEMR